MEVLNEVLQMLLYYHLVLFSRKTWDSDTRYGYGHSFLILLVLMMVINLIVTAVDSVVVARRRRKLIDLKTNYEGKIAEAKKLVTEIRHKEEENLD